MDSPYLTVIETEPYLRRAEKLLAAWQMEEVVMMVAADAEIGTVIPGGGGIRKFRYASQEGRGKRGGARVIYLAVTGKGKAWLLDIYAKGGKEDLSKAEIADMAKIAKILQGEKT
jgi:hypothetical protein